MQEEKDQQRSLFKVVSKVQAIVGIFSSSQGFAGHASDQFRC